MMDAVAQFISHLKILHIATQSTETSNLVSYQNSTDCGHHIIFTFYCDDIHVIHRFEENLVRIEDFCNSRFGIVDLKTHSN